MESNPTSEKALQGYMMFHHMLLYYGNTFPEIKKNAQAAIDNFVKDPRMRYKDRTPDLGA